MQAQPPPAVRRATAEDLPEVAEVYLAAFPESVRDLALERLRPQALIDIFDVCLAAEPDGFLVAELPATETSSDPDAGRLPRVGGYVLCPADVGRIRTTAIWGGHACRMLWRLLTGQYGIGFRTLRQVVADKLQFWRSADVPGGNCPARILSLAVHPATQGRGLGRLLFGAALDALRERTDGPIRLEVRPDNDRARRLYESYGFRTVGQVHDTRGPWDVMVLDASYDMEAE